MVMFVNKINSYRGTKQSKSGAWFELAWKDLKINRALYLMILPVIAFYVIFHYLPMYGATIAFKDYSPRLGILGSPWVGMKHVVGFLTGPYFWRVFKNTLVISLTSLICGFPAPIILALMINELRSKKFARVTQTITYLPHFISLVVVCGMIKEFTMDTGIINDLRVFLGMERITLLNQPQYFVPVYVISGIWQEVGWGSIIYLSALSGVDQQLYEAARIDGAGRLKQTWHVTLPGILPTIVVLLILRIGGLLSVGYEKIILLYNDGILETADVISTYVYRRGLAAEGGANQWSMSTAVGLFNSVINLILLIAANQLSRKINDTSLW